MISIALNSCCGRRSGAARYTLDPSAGYHNVAHFKHVLMPRPTLRNGRRYCALAEEEAKVLGAGERRGREGTV